MTKATDQQLIDLIGQKLRQLSVRVRDPKHPLHNRVVFDPLTGRPCMPDDDEECAEIILAALDEPDPS
jgi:hypothetical protein